jgi:precorrin-6B methylase 2
MFILQTVNNALYYVWSSAVYYVRTFLYDFIIVNYAENLNHTFLKSIPDNSSILEVGIATGLSLIKNRALIQKKKLSIDGIELDSDYIEACQRNIASNNLETLLKVTKMNLYNYLTEKKYDYILFSESYSVIPHVHILIEHCKRFLKQNTGKIIVLTTLEDEITMMKLLIKPRLYYFTTIDFGKVTTKAEFIAKIEHENEMIIDELKCIWNVSLPYVYGEIKAYMVKLSPLQDRFVSDCL